MRLSSRLAAFLVGGILAAFVYYWWTDMQIAVWCAERQRDPCRVPADGLVLGTAACFAGGALLGLIVEATAHGWQRRGMTR
jgi:hypothetical protein